MNNYSPSLVSISLRYLRKLPLSLDFTYSHSFGAAFVAELMNLGYLINNPQDVRPLDKKEYEEVLRTLMQMRGGHVVHSPLFKNFPAEFLKILQIYILEFWVILVFEMLLLVNM